MLHRIARPRRNWSLLLRKLSTTRSMLGVDLGQIADMLSDV
jgi:hypothetical protein